MILITGLCVVIAATALACGNPLLRSSPSSAASPVVATAAPTLDFPLGRNRDALGEPAPTSASAPGSGVLRGQRRGGLGEADGAVPEGTTVFDDGIPGVANLNKALLSALRRAATDAAGGGVVFYVDSGWRSPAYQAQLLQQAVSTYGSEKEAARWVATPNTSSHVSGDAVDIGPGAAGWLSQYGARYGLCQIYRNEPWHYELRPEAINRGCPSMYADPTHDPRMQQ
jgi:D-alanyl-D-alanine carboxypeptidase